MRFNKLLIVLLASFFVAGLLMVSNIRAQDKEIKSLRERVLNLETVINHDVRFKLAPSPESQKEFSSYRL